METLERDGAEDGPSAAELEERSVWRKRFLLCGGFPHLYRILVSATLQPQDDEDSATRHLRKVCVALVTKLVRFFLLGALSISNAALYQVVQLVRQRSRGAESLSKAIEAAATAVAGATLLDSEDEAGDSGDADEAGDATATVAAESGAADAPPPTAADASGESKGQATSEPGTSETGTGTGAGAGGGGGGGSGGGGGGGGSGGGADAAATEEAPGAASSLEQSPDFQQLVRQLSGQRGGKLSSMLLDHVDFRVLQVRTRSCYGAGAVAKCRTPT